ncbi:plasmid segregation protein ParM [Aneurinibacillus thermoaerophilus]|uniref:Plasmid segregation protein ParM n=1 Tax=Aneurinibacillus thermoaerophilus TaxID=143495 RepID=A0A1G8FMN6_ANETH|nr:ParM/StbA family protein [Aneurinibacillus thermoaerophilus]SDH83388.1 plasmid segregation protein ParM [Aneurinibacillus thermoaerophilus]
MTLQKAAVDIGNDTLKAMFEGEQAFTIPNVLANAPKDRGIAQLENSPFDALHVEVTSAALSVAKGIYYVGELAARQKHNDELTSEQKKGENDQSMILLLTALALHAAEESKEKKIEKEYFLSTGLPMTESKRKGARKAFKEKLIDHVHTVAFLDTPKHAGKTVTIRIKNAIVSPEGQAAYIGLAAKKPEVAGASIAIVDIGGLTTDIAVIEKGGKVDNEHSIGIGTGVSAALDAIIAEIDQELGIRPFRSRRELVDCILGDERGIAWYRGKSYDLNPIIDTHLTEVARTIYKTISDVWNESPQIRFAYIIGGGAALLEPYMKSINESKDSFPLRWLKNETAIWLIVSSYWDLFKFAGVNA